MVGGWQDFGEMKYDQGIVLHLINIWGLFHNMLLYIELKFENQIDAIFIAIVGTACTFKRMLKWAENHYCLHSSKNFNRLDENHVLMILMPHMSTCWETEEKPQTMMLRIDLFKIFVRSTGVSEVVNTSFRCLSGTQTKEYNILEWVPKDPVMWR